MRGFLLRSSCAATLWVNCLDRSIKSQIIDCIYDASSRESEIRPDKIAESEARPWALERCNCLVGLMMNRTCTHPGCL